MKVAVFSTRPYDRQFLDAANANIGHELVYYEARLTRQTVALAEGFESICVFVNDELDASTLIALAKMGTKLIALRCAGFNNVDIASATDMGIKVVRVPAYSPHAVAEHTVALMLALNRKITWAKARQFQGNYTLDGMLGFDMHERKVGVVGTGKIGECVARILHGFGCELLGYDLNPNPVCEELGMRYMERNQLFSESDIVTLHCPLMEDTYHVVNAESLALMKRGVMLINTSRGALVDAKAAIDSIKTGKIGYLGLDVYEEEQQLFFADHSYDVYQDDIFARLTTFPNVLITGHQAFFTEEALQAISETTLKNISLIEQGEECVNSVIAH